MLLPYGTALRLGKIPWVTLVVIALCVFIYWEQARNEAQIGEHVHAYCRSDVVRLRAIFEQDSNDAALSACEQVLPVLHSRPDLEVFFRHLQIYQISFGALAPKHSSMR